MGADGRVAGGSDCYGRRRLRYVDGSGGSGTACAKVSAARYLTQARVAFIGTMMAGDGVRGDRQLLLSPAKVRVSRYLKGRGPRAPGCRR
jgi:hypothetical protein